MTIDRARRRAEARIAAARRRRLRRRIGVVAMAGAAAAGIVVLAVHATGGGGSSTGGGRESSNVEPDPRPVAAFAPQRLPTAISGEAVAPTRGHLLVIGGLTAAGTSSRQILRLSPTGPAPALAGALRQPLHDAAAATIGGRTLVFGGGTATSTSAIEAVSKSGHAAAAGLLPRARSDLAAATVGGRAVIFGGYDGARLARDVLATSGRRLRTVARLPIPVRYPAVAAVGDQVYALGGETASGKPTAAIQRIDPAHGQAKVVGRLPAPTAHASAITDGNDVYVLGGTVRGAASDRIVAFDPGRSRAHVAGRLPIAVTNAAAGMVGGTGYLVGGLGAGNRPLASVITIRLRPRSRARSTAAPSGSGRPFDGRLLIADRGNNRLLLVNAKKRVLWRYPSRSRPAPAGGFYFPDDAFFTHHARGIISNQEQNDTIVQLAFPSGKVTWSYGHPRTAGSGPGYLHEPDDAYLLPGGTVTVADAQNCRVLWIAHDRRVRSAVGTPGTCVHDPPRSLGAPNGATPLGNGDVLVSEVNGSWVDELTRSGRPVWSVQLPIAYPSDPQPLGGGRYLVADYARPGGLYEFDRQGRILWSYHPTAGPGMLDHPSLAARLPNGLIAVNDDYRNRVVVIDPRTERIVWQYGKTDRPGTGANRLHTPDGFDLVAPGGRTPLHRSTG